VQERECAGEKNDLMALTPVVNSINGNNDFSMSVMARNNTAPKCIDSNSNSLKSGGVGSKKKDNNELDSKIVEEEFCLGQEVGLDGPQNSANTNLSITMGVISNRLGQHDVDGPIFTINSQNSANSINEDRKK
jgi:hypothetical protein